ncbi:MAG TPA: DUF1501 domain-containing protein, partial [Opitutae bacterium]|nr:DUF1501 domain-containing protein [Opitutae bacterium]
MKAPKQLHSGLNRRQFLNNVGGGIGAIALAKILSEENLLASSGSHSKGGLDPLAVKEPHYQPKVKRVIYLFMHGGPSHVDLLDPKPDLIKYGGVPLPESFGSVMTRREVAKNPLLPPIRPFRPRGKSGLEISDFLPHISSVADDLCVMRSCHGDSVN